MVVRTDIVRGKEIGKTFCNAGLLGRSTRYPKLARTTSRSSNAAHVIPRRILPKTDGAVRVSSYFLRTILIEFTASGAIDDESKARVRSPGFNA